MQPSKPKTYGQLLKENKHMRSGLDTIINRIGAIKVPNGTTIVLDRIAAAALTGKSIEAAAAKVK